MDEELVSSQIIRTRGRSPYGRSLARIGLRAQRLESALRLVEFGGPDTGGKGPCPACSRFPAQGHDESCFLAAALMHSDAITHAEEAIRYVRDQTRTTIHSFEVCTERVKEIFSELNSNLDQVSTILSRL